MISKNVVFVLGAGASVPYGMPSGAALMEQAKARPLATVMAWLPPHLRAAAPELHAAIRDAQTLSLDSLLEHRGDIRAAGTCFMARLLLQAEIDSLHHPNAGKSGGDWFRYLWSFLREGTNCPEAFAANKVSFVTFNYDRFIEQKIAGGLRADFNASDQQIRQVLDQVPVVHLHGSLGLLPFSSARDHVPFGHEISRSDEDAIERYALTASKHIKIVHDAQPDSVEFVRARGLLAEADTVYFLGFGYLRTNVQRLNVDGIPAGANVVLGCFGLTQNEYNWFARGPVSRVGDRDRPNIFDTRFDHDAYQVLREHMTFLVA